MILEQEIPGDWKTKKFKEALQDIVSVYSTGYKYDELQDDEERKEIDKQVNLLAHFHVYHTLKTSLEWHIDLMPRIRTFVAKADYDRMMDELR